MNNISYFFIAAAGGFVVMAAVTIQGLRTLCVTFPLIRATQKADPSFDGKQAKMRGGVVVALPLLFTVVVSSLLHVFAGSWILYGYWFGMVLALALSWKQLLPSNFDNMAHFQTIYGDCQVQPEPPVIDSQPPESQPCEDDDDVYFARPGR